MTLDRDEADPITPIRIDHRVDEIWADERGGTLLERYNYLEYHFERGGQYRRARAYLDTSTSVTAYGPFSARRALSRIDAPEFEADVLSYLARRFSEVKRL